MENQQSEPRLLMPWDNENLITIWSYRAKVLQLETTDPELVERKPSGGIRILEPVLLLIKHHVLRREKYYERVRREVEALENLEKIEHISRESIPDSVRLFVWQRDRGQCIKCGSRERLEFDHIIPVASGGSSTERNVQLLCEPCNRSKGASV